MSLNPMDLVALLKEQLRQATVLTGYAGDQGGFGLGCAHVGEEMMVGMKLRDSYLSQVEAKKVLDHLAKLTWRR